VTVDWMPRCDPIRSSACVLSYDRSDGADRSTMKSFFRLPLAGVMFFVSSWVLMLFAGVTAHDIGIRPFGYVTAMVATIGLWLVVAPAITAVGGKRKDRRTK
jgi:hypothetical protein